METANTLKDSQEKKNRAQISIWFSLIIFTQKWIDVPHKKSKGILSDEENWYFKFQCVAFPSCEYI